MIVAVNHYTSTGNVYSNVCYAGQTGMFNVAINADDVWKLRQEGMEREAKGGDTKIR